jgi:hypothetical protein
MKKTQKKEEKKEKFSIDITLKDRSNNSVLYKGKDMGIKKSVETLLNLLEYNFGYVPPIFVLGKLNKLNWHKSDKEETRQGKVLIACKNNYLTSARALQQLANRTTDGETRRKAWSDAKYFYLQHREYKKRQKGGVKK